jgi:hypothetical protein
MKILYSVPLQVLCAEETHESPENVRARPQSPLVHKLHAHLVEQFDDLGEVAQEVWVVVAHGFFFKVEN